MAVLEEFMEAKGLHQVPRSPTMRSRLVTWPYIAKLLTPKEPGTHPASRQIKQDYATMGSCIAGRQARKSARLSTVHV